MSKLTYTNVEYDLYGEYLATCEGLAVYLDIKSSENPEATVFIELQYDLETEDIKVDFESGESTYVPYGSTTVLYDDGFEINGIDTSEAVTFDGVLI